ncbi:MAG: helix-turn-helix domain-containing protein [Candidatus Melainabacteria bacterium]|nr:helix-turn-helix domain-containing protein [Candidatus Melainabacteria bacterium]
MSQAPYSIHPTVRQLLTSDSLAEAQVVVGNDLLDRQVSQVISSIGTQPRAGSLVVTWSDALSKAELSALPLLSALVIVKTSADYATGSSVLVSNTPNTTNTAATAVPSLVDAGVQRLIKRCQEAEVALIVVPSYGDPAQVVEDFRFVFLRELKHSSARLYSVMLSIVLEDGLDGLVETVSGWLNRPLVVETSEFKVLAARNMGATPMAQQRNLREEGANALRTYQKSREALTPGTAPHRDIGSDVNMTPFKLGRRLVFPVPLSDVLVGYVSVMIRPQDDENALCEYMHPLTLACKVDFSHRLKDSPTFSVTQKTLLKDLLSGRTLSAADQERLDRHFGFDLCDGFLVFAVDARFAEDGKATVSPSAAVAYPDDTYISCEAEGMRAFVIPYNEKSSEPWLTHAETLSARIKELNPGVKVRLGAGRLITTALDLPDAYGEARQALVVGSMIDAEGEFLLGYAELGIKRLLYLIIDHPESDRFLEENLSLLEAYDEEWESELVETLRVYVEHGANLNSTARSLFIHRHTLRYRLEQIADILKVDIDSQEVLLNLQIAYLIRDMKSGQKKR